MEKAYPNTFGPPHLTNKTLTIKQIYSGLIYGILKPSLIPKDILAEVEKQYAHRARPKGMKL